ncbi:MAG: S-methyl-5-thioribose-1-phosphate isomerase [Saprospiraceae bacterium]|nr:S-methyl-5-thioribose-1-phosphate isomerase [Saprospiraceae bacterium]
MKIKGQHYRTIWLKPGNNQIVQILDQRQLPHFLVVEDLVTLKDFEVAIREMHVRGAPLIGSTAAYGLYVACLNTPDGDEGLRIIRDRLEILRNTRPTAVDLFNATNRVWKVIQQAESSKQRAKLALAEAQALTEESVENCRLIGQHGLPLIEAISNQKGGDTVHILTHCNAGWLACIDHGTATAPIYAAHDKGISIHVWVDETRPRNQGARLTAFELLEHEVPHTVITDNTGGHLMQHGMVDMVIVGSDRTTRTGDVANKIGTYLKALAAHDNNIPFYVALPYSSFDWTIHDGLKDIPIEERNPNEVYKIRGLHQGEIKEVMLTPEASPAANYGFDVTPARLVTGIITERGVSPAHEEGLLKLYPEQK